MSDTKLFDGYKRMFRCDTARITNPCGRLFLIIGFKERSVGKWFKNGEPYDFDYIREQVVASGETRNQLLASARHYLGLMRPRKKARRRGKQ